MTPASARAPWSRPSRAPLVMLTATVALVAAIEICLLVTVEGPLGALLTLPALGCLYAVGGLVAWWRRPRNPVGAILVVGALAHLAAALNNTDSPALAAIGSVTATLPLAVIVHLVLAFPSGSVGGRTARLLTVAGYVNSTVLESPRYLFGGDPGSALLVAARPDLVAAGSAVQRVTGALIVAGVALILAARVRSATPAQRRALAPLYVYGIATVLTIPLAHVVTDALGLSPQVAFVVQATALAGIPLAFTASLLRGGFSPSVEVDRLAAIIGTEVGTRPRMAAALAGTLGDASLQIVFEDDDPALTPQDRPADTSPAEPGPNTGRSSVDVDLAGRRVARIFYDDLLIPDRQQVLAAGRVVAIELDRERLTGELVRRGSELRQSRARLLDAQDTERRRIAHDLHDGLQSQLVLLSWRAARLAKEPGVAPGVAVDATELHHDLDLVAEELRRLVHGLMPALLTEQGLYAAVEDLLDDTPFRVTFAAGGSDRGLPTTVESTLYLVVAETLTNAVKYARAEHLCVDLTRRSDRMRVEIADDGVGGADARAGSGLSGMAERVDVLGGTFVLTSPPSGGTRLLVEVPCAP